MPAPDELETLVDDLRRLPGAKRRAVLAALTPFERARIQAALAEVPRAEASDDGPDLAGFSPWLAAKIGEAREEGSGKRSAGSLTPAVRRLLAALAQAPRAEARAPAPSRSLLGAIAGLLASRRAIP